MYEKGETRDAWRNQEGGYFLGGNRVNTIVRPNQDWTMSPKENLGKRPKNLSLAGEVKKRGETPYWLQEKASPKNFIKEQRLIPL